MPVSAYIQAALFVVLNAVALFAAAGTIEILGFWVYVAIFAGVMVASFASSTPGCCVSGCGRAVNGRRWGCACSPWS